MVVAILSTTLELQALILFTLGVGIGSFIFKIANRASLTKYFMDNDEDDQYPTIPVP
jgi:hypothetical protein